MLRRPFSRRWLLTTLLVLLASAVMVRLGIWQLDRLEQRRAFNDRVLAQQAADPLVLDETALDLDLYSMEYRHVVVTGEYLPQDEIVLRNQVWNTEFGQELGVKLFTPLVIQGTQVAVLVDRGWIPQDHEQDRAAYIQPGTVTIAGQLRRAETDYTLFQRPDPTLTPNEDRLDVWNNLDLDRLASQMDTTLLPVYVQIVPDAVQSDPPFANPPELDLSEGSHFGYAVQWFSFATLLLVGYPFYIRRQETKIKA
jgi:surfeit locus 1 family protein